MNKKWLLLIILGLVLMLAAPALTGCSSTVTAQDATTTAPPVQVSQQPQGIWVSGTGQVTATPDIAVLNLGVTAQEAAVTRAQSEASDAMNAVMKALADNGVAQKDIQTGYFSISQRTRYDQTTQTEVVAGYQVSNMVTVKIRDTGKVGDIIDAVVGAGGDFIRINGISFSIDDPTPYYAQAREKAMADAKNKARQLAELAGLTLGKPTYIAEGAQSSPVYYREAMAVPVPTITAAAAPPISSGESTVTLNVQVAYSVTP